MAHHSSLLSLWGCVLFAFADLQLQAFHVSAAQSNASLLAKDM